MVYKEEDAARLCIFSLKKEATDYEVNEAAFLSSLFFPKIFNLFIHERQKERGRNTGRGRSRLHTGNLTWDSILGL